MLEFPIHEAAMKKDMTTLKELVDCLPSQAERSRKINQKDKSKKTPLFYAIFHNSYEMIDYLLT